RRTRIQNRMGCLPELPGSPSRASSPNPVGSGIRINLWWTRVADDFQRLRHDCMVLPSATFGPPNDVVVVRLAIAEHGLLHGVYAHERKPQIIASTARR